MKKKLFKYIKIFVSMALILSLVAPSYASLSASDGSAFVTKAEFDSALADFNARLTTFEAGINSKIDSQVTSYLDRNGIWSGRAQTMTHKWVASTLTFGTAIKGLLKSGTQSSGIGNQNIKLFAETDLFKANKSGLVCLNCQCVKVGNTKTTFENEGIYNGNESPNGYGMLLYKWWRYDNNGTDLDHLFYRGSGYLKINFYEQLNGTSVNILKISNNLTTPFFSPYLQTSINQTSNNGLIWTWTPLTMVVYFFVQKDSLVKFDIDAGYSGMFVGTSGYYPQSGASGSVAPYAGCIFSADIY